MSLTIPRIWWPQTTTLPAVSFSATATAGAKTYTSTLVASATYYDPEALATALATALGAAKRDGTTAFTADGGTVTGEITAAGLVKLTFGGTASGDVAITWSGSTTLGALTGFGSTNTPASAGLVLTATNTPTGLWTPDVPVASDPAGGEPRYTATVVEAVGGQSKTVYWAARTVRPLRFEFLPASKVWTASETATTTGQAIQNLVESAGRARLRYWPDRETLGTPGTLEATVVDASASVAWRDYYLRQESMDRIKAERFSVALDRWSLDLDLGAYVA